MIEAIVIVILFGLLGIMLLQRQIDREEFKSKLNVVTMERNIAVQDYEMLRGKLEQKALTAREPRAQDVGKPKPLSGAQLRRLAEQESNQQMAALQERPNSEILKENEHGGRDAQGTWANERLTEG